MAMNDAATPTEKPRILVVDDQRLNLNILHGLLKDDYQVMVAASGEQALKAVAAGRPDLILLDVNMPDMDGYEICRRLKQDPTTMRIPVIFITAMSESEDEARGFELGAADYIVKPFKAAVVRARVQAQIRLKRQDESLRSTEEWYHRIIESAPDGLLVVDDLGVIRLANASAAAMFGYGAQEMAGMAVDVLVPGASRADHATQRDAFFKVGTTRQMFGGDRDLRGCRKYGTEFPVEVGLSRLPKRDGYGEMVCVTIRDITQRKQEERVLARQRATMQKVLENSPIGMAIEAAGTLRYVNPEFGRLFGVDTGDPADKVGVSLEVRRRITQRLRAGESLRNIEFNRPLSGGETGHFMATYGLIDHDGDEGIMAWVVDITDRARVERLKKEFISTVSHELRTPLTSIRGSLALLVNGVVGQLPPAALPLVKIAHSNSERLILLVNDILDMEKLEAGRMEFDIQAHELMPLMQQAVDANRPYAQQHQVDYVLEESAPEAWVSVDVNRFLQVIANLLSNAAKFSPPGQVVSVGVLRHAGCWRIEVRDRGSGIPEAFRGRIFQKFAQADSSDTRKKGGTGLGLTITKSIVERMGGQIGFESTPDVLTTFHVELPVTDAPAKSNSQSAA